MVIKAPVVRLLAPGFKLAAVVPLIFLISKVGLALATVTIIDIEAKSSFGGFNVLPETGNPFTNK